MTTFGFDLDGTVNLQDFDSPQLSLTPDDYLLPGSAPGSYVLAFEKEGDELKYNNPNYYCLRAFHDVKREACIDSASGEITYIKPTVYDVYVPHPKWLDFLFDALLEHGVNVYCASQRIHSETASGKEIPDMLWHFCPKSAGKVIINTGKVQAELKNRYKPLSTLDTNDSKNPIIQAAVDALDSESKRKGSCLWDDGIRYKQLAEQIGDFILASPKIWEDELRGMGAFVLILSRQMSLDDFKDLTKSGSELYGRHEKTIIKAFKNHCFFKIDPAFRYYLENPTKPLQKKDFRALTFEDFKAYFDCNLWSSQNKDEINMFIRICNLKEWDWDSVVLPYFAEKLASFVKRASNQKEEDDVLNDENVGLMFPFHSRFQESLQEISPDMDGIICTKEAFINYFDSWPYTSKSIKEIGLLVDLARTKGWDISEHLNNKVADFANSEGTTFNSGCLALFFDFHGYFNTCSTNPGEEIQPGNFNCDLNQLLLYFNIRFFTYKNTHCFTTKEAGSIKRFFEISTLKGWDVTDHLKDKLTSFLEKEERNINPEIVDLILDHLAKTSPPTQYIDGLSGSLRSALQDSIEDIYRIWPTTNEIVIVQPEAVESIIGALLSAIATALNPMPEDLLFELGVLRPLANHQNLMSRFYGRIIDPALTKALHNIGITNPSCISFFTNALKLLFSLSPVNNTASNASGLHYLDCDTTTSKLETLVRVHLAVSTEDADTSRKEAEVMALISTQLESEKESRKVYQYLVATFDVFVEKLEKKGIALDRAKRIAFGLLTFVGGLFVTQPPGMLFFLFSGANDWGYIGADLFFMAVGLIASVALGGTSYTFSFEQGKKNLRKLGSCLSCSCFFQTPEESLLPTTDPLALMADGLRDMRMSSILTGEENDLEAPLLAAPH